MSDCEIADGLDTGHKRAPYFDKSLLHLNDVGVVANVAACRAEMNNWLGIRTNFAVGKNVRHNVVADLPFPCLGKIVIDVVDMRLHFVNLRVRDRDTKLLFRLGKRNPEPAPGAELKIRREDVFHPLACISFTKRRYVVIHMTSE